MTREEEYEYRLKHRNEKQMQLAKEYNCNGLCYGNKFMCPRAEICPHTGPKEGIATLLVILTFIIGPIIVLIAILWWLL